jgi:predicted RNA-binding protein with PIN domain
VVFSPAHLSADAWIERAAHDGARARPMLVVTSDRLEREAASASGADTMGCGDFLELCDRAERTLATRRPAVPPPRPTIGDRFPSAPDGEARARRG